MSGLWAPVLISLTAVAQLSLAQESKASAAQAPAPEAARLELSLDDALRLALENNLDLEIEAAGLDALRERAYGSWGAFDPLYEVTARVTDRRQQAPSSLSGADVLKENTQSVTGDLKLPFTTGGTLDLGFSSENSKTNNQFSLADTATNDALRVSYTQPFWRGAWSRYATTEQRLSEIALAQERERREQLVQDLLLSVHRAYWDLVAARDLLGVRELALQLGREQLEQDQRRLDVGVGTEVDVLQSETNVAQREEQLLRARTDLKQASDALRTLLFRRAEGEDWDATAARWEALILPSSAPPGVEFARPDVAQLLPRAFEARAELRQQRWELEAAELRLARANSDRDARLDGTLTASSQGFDGDPQDAFQKALLYDYPTFEASLTLSGSFRNRSAIGAERAARHELRSAHLAFEKLELDVLAELRSAVRELEYQALAVGAANKSADLARRQLEAERARNAQGLSTTFQLLEFQQTLSEALATRSTAQASYAKARAQLARALGALRLGELP